MCIRDRVILHDPYDERQMNSYNRAFVGSGYWAVSREHLANIVSSSVIVILARCIYKPYISLCSLYLKVYTILNSIIVKPTDSISIDFFVTKNFFKRLLLKAFQYIHIQTRLLNTSDICSAKRSSVLQHM